MAVSHSAVAPKTDASLVIRAGERCGRIVAILQGEIVTRDGLASMVDSTRVLCR
jgi:hypothetical protein